MTSSQATPDLEPGNPERVAGTGLGELPDQDVGPTVAVAESCTGGLLASRIVDVPGSGDWFKGGLVAYDAEVKYNLLQVPEGPVITPEAAIEMARGVRGLMNANIGIATTGVAGPDPEEGQPVGTVFIGIVDDATARTLVLRLDGSPAQIIDIASSHAIEQVFRARAAFSGKAGSQVPAPLR